jgi:uncharacterized membrane-anchored protein YitT (DUF2179 family)
MGFPLARLPKYVLYLLEDGFMNIPELLFAIKLISIAFTLMGISFGLLFLAFSRLFG